MAGGRAPHPSNYKSSKVIYTSKPELLLYNFGTETETMTVSWCLLGQVDDSIKNNKLSESFPVRVFEYGFFFLFLFFFFIFLWARGEVLLFCFGFFLCLQLQNLFLFHHHQYAYISYISSPYRKLVQYNTRYIPLFYPIPSTSLVKVFSSVPQSDLGNWSFGLVISNRGTTSESFSRPFLCRITSSINMACDRLECYSAMALP